MFPNTITGNLQYWLHHQLLSIGWRKPPTLEQVAVQRALAAPPGTSMEVEGGGGVRGANTAPAIAVPTGLPTFKPNQIFTSKDGNFVDARAIPSHTVVLGMIGGGKTHLTLHLIMQWAVPKGWAYGWVAGMMPRDTWLNNPRYKELLEEKQVIFIDEYKSKKEREALIRQIERTVSDNRRNCVPSLLLIDDCAYLLLRGLLDIGDLLTNGRTKWLTVISLWQDKVKSGQYGSTIRSNGAVVVFFESMISHVANADGWVHKKAEFEELVRPEVTNYTAGVLVRIPNAPKGRGPFKVTAPATYPVTTLGRLDLRGKLLNLEDTDDDMEVDEKVVRARLSDIGVPPKKPRRRKQQFAVLPPSQINDDGDEYTPSGSESDTEGEQSDPGVPEDPPQCRDPPGCTAAVYDAEDRVYRCGVCGWQVLRKKGETEADDGDDLGPGDDDQGRGGGGGGRKRERSPSADGGGDPAERSKAVTTDDRVLVFTSKKHRQQLLTVVRNTVEQECRAVLAVTDRVCDWITRLAVAEVKVELYDPMAELQQKQVELERTVAEQQFKIAELEDRVSMLDAEQHRVAELEKRMVELEQQMAPGNPGRPKNAVTKFTRFLTGMVAEMQVGGDSGAPAKSDNPVEMFAQHIAGMVAQQQQSR
eukprot:m.226909 g.226909  ORF g.226909 m.226909 type:complete len:644 (-) comp25935_c1_seq12:3842-5773(-)